MRQLVNLIKAVVCEGAFADTLSGVNGHTVSLYRDLNTYTCKMD